MMDMSKRSEGKSITTSVPTFAIRFHAEDEELEEIYPSADEADDEADKQDEDPDSLSSGAPHAPSSGSPTPPAMSASSSSTAVTTAVHSRDPSPMKEYFKGLGKRSTSVDAGIIDTGGIPSSGSDTWRIFHELKGKITKTVEEKLCEIKNDRKSSSSVFSGGSGLKKGGKPVGGSNSKDDSSISESESASESSNKGQDLKEMSTVKPNITESPKKTSAVKPNEDTAKKYKETNKEAVVRTIEHDISPNVSFAIDTLEVSDTPTVVPTSPKRSYRSKLKSVRGLRHRHKPKSKGISIESGGVSMSSLGHSEDHENDEDNEIESGVEVSEETNFIRPIDTHKDYEITTTDYRTCPPSQIPGTRSSRFSQYYIRSFHFGPLKNYFLLLLGIISYAVLPIPVYMAGFVGGVAVTVVLYSILDWISKLLAPKGILTKKPFSVPTYANMPILEVPAAKEYQPVHKFCGWMNEYPDTYDPQTYSISEAQSVYVYLEGSTLYLSHTRTKIPKRAMWNERKRANIKFVCQRIYNIFGCEVKLLPDGLTSKRLWSKKYPISIALQKSSKRAVGYLKNDGLSDDQTEEISAIPTSENLELRTSDSDGDITSSDVLANDATDKDDADTSNQGTPVLQDEDLELSDEDDTFCHIDKTALEETCLYLFARTDREKEEWYRHFVAAVKMNSDSPNSASDSHPTKLVKHNTSSVTEFDMKEADETSPTRQQVPLEPDQFVLPSAYSSSNISYLSFMERFNLQVHPYLAHRIRKASCLHSHEPYSYSTSQPDRHSEKMDTELDRYCDAEVECDVMWFNALVGRVLFDVLRDKELIEKIRERIQKKLATIKLPYFIEEILATELELSQDVPLVHRASRPLIDERGLWVDLDVTYEGTSSLTLETKLNLMKLKEAGKVKHPAGDETGPPLQEIRSPMFHSDVDDSAESSSDEFSSDDEQGSSPSHKSNGTTGKKILTMVNKIAASKYFQHATDYKYIKRAMEGVSNTKIVLVVEVKGLVGTLALNIPPPPSDRLWYGFRGNPRLWISAHPKFGERQLNIGHITSWIEKKLILEFQKKFVYPNMDDLVIPLMTNELPH